MKHFDTSFRTWRLFLPLLLFFVAESAVAKVSDNSTRQSVNGQSHLIATHLDWDSTLTEHPDTTIAIIPDTNGIIYVTQNGAGLRNGSSWADATPWLNHALTVADTMTVKPKIWVAKGTYYGTLQQYDNDTYAFIGRNGVNVFGGFSGNEPADYDLASRNFEENETRLDGLLQYNVLLPQSSEWNGFHILNGVNGCVFSPNVKSILRNCSVTNCLSNGIFAGILNYNSIVDSCDVSHNTGNGINSVQLNVSNTRISYNNGYGLRAIGEIYNCIIYNNGGDGYYVSGSSSVRRNIYNCVVANNNGTGIMVSNVNLVNSIVVNNGGNGLEICYNNCKIENCIVWGNGGSSIACPQNRQYELVHCAIEGDYKHSSDLNIPLASPGDTSGIQPGFVHPTAGVGPAYSGGDWHLLPNSVCVNRGCADGVPTNDLDGNARIRQNVPDLGAYESDYMQSGEEDNHIIYIKENGTGNGSSWQNATSDLTRAIETAWIYGPSTRIWVAQGNYSTPNAPFYLKENLKLYGGFEGNEASDYSLNMRNILAHATILDGQNQNRVLHQTFDFENAAVVDGFTLTHGNADQGAGACLMANTTLSKCRIVNNTAGENGAALYAMRDNLKQLIIENNDALGVRTTESQITHCNVVRNSRGGLLMSVENPMRQNSLTSSIIWGNSQRNLDFTDALSEHNTIIKYCAIDNYLTNGENNILLSSSNEAALGPHFVLPSDSTGITSTIGNWNLDSNSVCLNTGVNDAEALGIPTDIAGQPRVQQGRADAGALESPHAGSISHRHIVATIYEGETYSFYGSSLSQTGWYTHRWQTGTVDSVVTLDLTVKHIIYVSVNGSGMKNGSSWANALDGETASDSGRTKLADALANATVGAEFWLQSGTYHACSDSDVNKSLILNDGVALYGGFAGTESSVAQRNPLNPPTLFSGNLQQDTIKEHYSRNIFHTNESNNFSHLVVLNHISISDGYNDNHSGAALHIHRNGGVHISCCRIHHHLGTALSNEGFLEVYNCVIDSNKIYYDEQQVNYPFLGDLYAGALINATTGCVNLSRCTIADNTAPSFGAVLNYGILAIDSSEIYRNYATIGHVGAIRSETGLTITNSTLTKNQAYRSCSVLSVQDKLIMHHCVVDSNQCYLINPQYMWPQEHWTDPQYGPAAHIISDGEADVSDCLFTHNHQNGQNDGGCLHFNGYANVRKCNFINNICAGNSHSFYVNWGVNSGDEPIGGIGMSVVYNTLDNDGGGIHVETGDVYVEDCIFDGHIGNSGTSASIHSGKLTMNRCVFTRNWTESGIGDGGIVTIRTGELLIQNSLFANNSNVIFNTTTSQNSTTTFSNCTFANNRDHLMTFLQPNTLNLVPNPAYNPDDGSNPLLVVDTSHVKFNNCIITGDWEVTNKCIGFGGILYYPNYVCQITNTLFHHPDSTLATDCTPDSLGNIYHCDPMFVNPTSVMGFDSVQNSLLYDFRLLPGSPAINSGDTSGLHLTPDATDLAGEWRVKRCQIDRGCYEYGTIVYDTLHETLCVETDSLDQLSYSGHGFDLAQIKVGENSFTRTCDCHPDANDTVLTLQLFVSVIQHTAFDTVACDSMVWNGVAYAQSGDFVQTLTDVVGCDSMVTMHLTVKASTASSMEQAVCGSYEWNGVTYTESGIYTQTLTNAVGCDSIVTLHLTVNSPVYASITEVACESYTWNGTMHTQSGDYTHTFTASNGCDSIVTLYLTVYDDATSEFSITTPDSCYIWNGQTYCASGDYTQTLQTVHGCDSVVTLHLTITVGIEDHDVFDFRVYPNPTSNIVNVECAMTNDELGGVELHLCDAYGRLLDVVETGRAPSLQTAQIDLSRYASGIYFVKAVADGKTVAVRKVVKQ